MTTLSGDKALLRKMDSLERKVRDSIARSAVGAAAGPLNKAMKAAVPAFDNRKTSNGVVETKDLKPLKRSIGRRRKRYRNSGVHSEFIGPRYLYIDKKTGDRPSAWAWSVEYGDEDNAAQPFVRPTFDAHRHSSIKLMADKFRERIIQEARKP